jgi:hypothetical protein
MLNFRSVKPIRVRRVFVGMVVVYVCVETGERFDTSDPRAANIDVVAEEGRPDGLPPDSPEREAPTPTVEYRMGAVGVTGAAGPRGPSGRG